MVASGRNIVISCFEARALAFFARTSHNSSPHKRFETPFLTPKRTKCLQKFLNGILTKSFVARGPHRTILLRKFFVVKHVHSCFLQFEARALVFFAARSTCPRVFRPKWRGIISSAEYANPHLAYLKSTTSQFLLLRHPV